LWYRDELCIGINGGLNSTRCYSSDFYLATTITENLWLHYFNVSDIGGILGMGYNTTGSNSFWENSGVYPQRYSTSLYPTVEDWSWQSNPPSLNGLPNSNLMFGEIDTWLYNSNELDGVIVVNNTKPGQLMMGL